MASLQIVAKTYDYIDPKITNPATGEFLKYNATIRKWINSTSLSATDITMTDEGWIGLGAAKGRLVFNDETTDLLQFKDCAMDVDGAFTAGSITSDAGVSGTILTMSSYIRMANSVAFQARNNADSAYDDLFNYNTSDHIEFTQPIETGSIQGVTNGGMQLLSDVPVDADAVVDSEHGQYVSAGSVKILEWGGEALDAGSIDKPFVRINGALTQETNVIRKVVSLAGATDNAATEIFTITTANETGDVDGGAYSVKVHLLGTETVAAATAANASAISLTAHWTRLMLAGGTGTTSAVAEISESAANDLGTGAISAITITTAETSEYVNSVLLNINTSGGTFDGYAMVELVYHGFTTPPIISD